MDIMVSSNFERYLYDLFGRDPEQLKEFMARSSTGRLQVSDAQWRRLKEVFSSYAVTDEQTCAMIRQVYDESGVLLDPHTAVGVKAARECNSDHSVPMITLATAHPVKFAEAIQAAGIEAPSLPAHLQDLMERPESCTVVDNSVEAVTRYISDRLAS